MVRDSSSSFIFTRFAVLWALSRIESPTPVQQTPSIFHPRAQRNAFRRRGARLQQRVFAPRNQRFGLAAMEFRLKVDYENIKLRFT
jgi:hypothetical protein